MCKKIKILDFKKKKYRLEVQEFLIKISLCTTLNFYVNFDHYQILQKKICTYMLSLFFRLNYKFIQFQESRFIIKT